MSAGVFIAIEGIDGAGTTTQARLLAERLRRRGRDVLETAEPSGGPVGKLLREAVRGHLAASDAALVPLFAADRLHHFDHEIRPFLERGGIVLSDRYLLSSLAYQSLACDVTWVREVNRHAPLPQQNLYVRVGLAVAKARRLARGGAEERFDADDKQRRVIAAYDAAVLRDDVGPCVTVDGEADVETVAARIDTALAPLFA